MGEKSVDRPKRVSFIALLLIGSSLLIAAYSFVDLFNPGFFQRFAELSSFGKFRYLLPVFGLVVIIAAGYNMLKGKNWSRWLYIGWITVSTAFNVAMMGIDMAIIYGLAIHIVFIFGLLTPKANEYFTGSVAKSTSD